MSISLSDVLARYRSAVDGNGIWTDPNGSAAAPYMDLHLLYTLAWRTRIRTYNVSVSHAILAGATALLAVINVFACSCIPAIYLVVFAYILSVVIGVDLINVAAANAQIESLRSLYLDAARELGELRRRAVAVPGSAAMLSAMDGDLTVLGIYADVDRFRARVLGFVVTFGALRSLGIAVVTLTVGLWSVLRGLGVFVTMETICTIKDF